MDALRRGEAVTCSNALHMSVAELNEAVLQAVEQHAWTPEAIEQVINLSERDDTAERQDALRREQKDVTKRIARLVAAIETGSDAASLVTKLRELEARQRAIPVELASLRSVPTQGRTVLQRILRGRLTFTPSANFLTGEVDGYDFQGPTRFDKLFTGVAVERPAGIDEGILGNEGIGPEDTHEGDYGRLLESVYGKGLASPTGFEPVF